METGEEKKKNPGSFLRIHNNSAKNTYLEFCMYKHKLCNFFKRGRFSQQKAGIKMEVKFEEKKHRESVLGKDSNTNILSNNDKMNMS